MTGPAQRGPAIPVSLAGPGPANHQNRHLNRSTEMQLIHEDLARAHAAQRLDEAVARARVHRLAVAYRAQRRAELAAARARRLLACAVVG